MTTQVLTFEALVQGILSTHRSLSSHAVRAINTSLTLRNWLVGFYIEEYERGGTDRGAYGERLMDELAAGLTATGLPNCNRRQLYRYLDFFRAYLEEQWRAGAAHDALRRPLGKRS